MQLEKTINGTKVQVSDYLKPPEFSLKHLCRETIRKHLLDIDPLENLFGRIPQLGLPSSLTVYLLYSLSLDDDADNDKNSSYIDYDDNDNNVDVDE